MGVTLVIIALLAGLLLGAHRGYGIAERKYRVKAVKLGAAEWVVVDAEGNTEFQWIIPESTITLGENDGDTLRTEYRHDDGQLTNVVPEGQLYFGENYDVNRKRFYEANNRDSLEIMFVEENGTTRRDLTESGAYIQVTTRSRRSTRGEWEVFARDTTLVIERCREGE